MPFNSETASKAGRKSKRGPEESTKKVREALHKLLEDNSSNLEQWLADVAKEDPKEALKIFSNLTEYALPKLARTEIDAVVENNNINLEDLTDEQLEQLDSILSSSKG